MPSRLTFICPRGTTSAGTERSTSLPTASRSSVSRAALVCPPAVSTSTSYSSNSSSSPAALAVSQVSTTEVAPVSISIGVFTPLILACSANSPAWPRGICTARDGVAGTRDLFRVAISNDGAGRRSKHQKYQQNTAHSPPPVQVVSQVVSNISRALDWPPSRAEPGQRPPCARRAAPSPHAAPRFPSGASARSPATYVRSRNRGWSWGRSYRLQYTAFLCSLRDSEMVSVVCASTPVTIQCRHS